MNETFIDLVVLAVSERLMCSNSITQLMCDTFTMSCLCTVCNSRCVPAVGRSTMDV
jgi:hypothetical protein